jgi:hypothetical protein
MANTRGIFTLRYIVEEKVPFDDWVALSDVWVNPSPSVVSLPNTGYFGGGDQGPYYSTMDKVTYASDTTAAIPGAALSIGRRQLAATGNSEAGYFGGGGYVTGTPAVYSTMDKVTYSTDTTAAVPGAALSVARHNGAATGNSTAGYFGGGYDGSNIRSTMDKVTYSTDTTAQVPGAALSVARGGHDASSARANALPGSAPVVV